MSPHFRCASSERPPAVIRCSRFGAGHFLRQANSLFPLGALRLRAPAAALCAVASPACQRKMLSSTSRSRRFPPPRPIRFALRRGCCSTFCYARCASARHCALSHFCILALLAAKKSASACVPPSWRCHVFCFARFSRHKKNTPARTPSYILVLPSCRFAPLLPAPAPGRARSRFAPSRPLFLSPSGLLFSSKRKREKRKKKKKTRFAGFYSSFALLTSNKIPLHAGL